MRKFCFIYPEDYFNKNQVDSSFLEEYNEFKSNGFTCLLINDSFNKITGDIQNLDKDNIFILYRGWMLNENQYTVYIDSLKYYGFKNYISLEEYSSTNYIDNWVNLIPDLTIPSIIVRKDNISNIKIPWEKFFVKGSVKSLGLNASICSSIEEIKNVIAKLELYNSIETENICIRELKNLSSMEFRYFVLNGKAYSNNDIIQEGVFLCAEKIKSKFFSVDISLDLQTGKNIIVEIGDGQVSGLKQWSIQNFCSMFLNKF